MGRAGTTPRRTRIWRAAEILIGVVLIGALVRPELADTSGPAVAAPPAAASSAAGSAPAAGTAASTQPDAGARAALVDRSGIAELLARRSAAVADHDEAAFLATIDAGSPTLLAEQTRLFANLARVAPTRWTYSLAELGPELPMAVLRRLGGTAVLAHVVLRYRLPRVDQVDAVRNEWLTFVKRDGDWRLAGTTDGTSLGLRTDVDVWDLAPVTVASGPHSLVISAHGSASSYVAQVDAAVGRVGQVWARPWSHIVAVVVPASQAQMAQVLNEPAAGLSQIAAVTTGRISTADSPPTADRVVINPGTFAGLSSLGKRVVLTHEITHVATRAITTGPVPLWLSEGFADYVGYRGTGVPVGVAASDVVRAVRAGRVPSDLPADAAFDADVADISPAYEESWLAVRLLVQLYGPGKVADFYFAVASSHGSDGRQAVQTALEQVLGISRATLVQRWRDQMIDLG